MPFPSPEYLIGVVQSLKFDEANVGLSLLTRDTCSEEAYGFDVLTRNKGITNFRNPEAVAGVLDLIKKKRVLAKLHYLKDKKSLSKRTLKLEQAPGKRSAEEFKKRLIIEAADLNAVQERTFEAIVWPMLLTGILTVTEEKGVTSTYDFEMANTAEAVAPWDVPADSDPISDLLAAKKVIQVAAGEEAVEILIPSEAIHMAMRSPKLQAMIGDSTKDKYTLTAKVDKLADLNIRIVDTGYTPDGGSFQYHLSDNGTDANMALIKAPGSLGVFMEGEPTDGNAPPNMAGRFPRVFTPLDPAIPHFMQEWPAIPGFTLPNKAFALKLY